MIEITYLIEQSQKFLTENQIEIGCSYKLDAWISLKEYMNKNDMKTIDELYCKTKKDTEIIKNWITNFNFDSKTEEEFKIDIEIISGILSFFELNNEDTILYQRSLADCYFNIKEYETVDKLYSTYIEKNPKILEYYYGYSLTLIQREEYIKAINILEEGLDKAATSDYFIEPSFEILIDSYESINETENANKARQRKTALKNLS